MFRVGRLLAACFTLLLVSFASVSMVSAEGSATPVAPDSPGNSLSSLGDEGDIGTLGTGDIYGFITITTADLQPLPANTYILVHNTTTGNDLYGNGNAESSTMPLAISPASTSDSVTVTITAAGYQSVSDTFTLGATDYSPTYTLQPAGMVYSTLTIETSDTLAIPAGTLISVNNGSLVGAQVYGEGMTSAVAAPRDVPIPPVSTGSDLYVTITGATGYADLTAGPFTVDALDLGFTVELQALIIPTITISTSDSGDIPVNTTVAVYKDSVFWQGLSVSPAAGSPHTITLPDVPDGTVLLVQVYNAANYEPINADPVTITSGTTNIDVTIKRIFTPTITISTSDGQNIPENATVAIFKDGDTSAVWWSNGVDLDGAPSVTLTLPDVPDGTVLLAQVYNAANYDPINATPITITTGSTSIEVIIQRTVITSTLTITTEDGNPIPVGAHIVVTNTSDSDAVVLDQTGATAGATNAISPVIPSSNLAVSITGATGYADITGATFTVAADGDNFDVELLTLPVDITVSTADSQSIPAGTTWELRDSLDNPLQNGVISGGIASNLGLTNPIFNDSYILYVTDPTGAYLPFSTGFEVTATVKDFSFSLTPTPVVIGDVQLTVTTSDGGNIPAGTIITVGGITYTATGSETSNSIIPFTGVPEGTQGISATNSAPYASITGSVDVVAGSSVDASIALIRNVEPLTTGDVNLAASTSDNNAIPTGTIFTLGGVTFTAAESDFSTADLASGSIITFTGVPEGTQTLTVTNAAPYEDFTGSVEVVAGETLDAAITLQLTEEPVESTPTPTQPSEPATPGPTATNPPTNPQNPVLPGKTPVPGDVTPGDGTSGGSGVNTLPSTGQQPSGTSDAPWMLLGMIALLAIVTLGAATRMRRR